MFQHLDAHEGLEVLAIICALCIHCLLQNPLNLQHRRGGGTMTFVFGLQATLGEWWSTMIVLVPFQHGHLFHTFVSGFPHIVMSSVFCMISQSFLDQAKIGWWPSKYSNTGNISCRTSSIYFPLFNSQKPTLNVLKHLPKNSIIHGLNTKR